MSGTVTPRLVIANLDQWGKLVKSWATDLDYVSQPYASQPPRNYWVNTSWPGEAGRTPAPSTVPDTTPTGAPQPWCLPAAAAPVNLALANGGTVALPYAVALSVADFRTKLGAASVVISSMPPACTNVIIVQGDDKTMVIRLPPKDTLQGSEDDLLNGVAYPFPPFYAQVFNGPPTPPTTQAAIMQLHANRIGEYTMNNCN